MAPGTAMTDVDRLEHLALLQQLSRMRAVQYAYNKKFFSLLLFSVVAIALAFVERSIASLVLLAFGLVSAGVTASFFLHFCDFARTHARALEARINTLLGRRVLLASELEEDYFYPHEARKLSGFVPTRPDSFFSFFTLHFTIVWAASIALALALLRSRMGGWTYLALFIVLGGWIALNASFLLRWFSGDAEKRMAAALRAAYDLDRSRS